MKKEITFGERWGRRSYLVTYDGPYENDKPPHVQTPEENLTGKTFQLGARKQVRVRDKTAVIYDVPGVTNRGEVAHITVYFGVGAPVGRALDEY